MHKLQKSLLSHTALVSVLSSVPALLLATATVQVFTTDSVAAGCVVIAGDTLECNAGETYVPTDHGGRPMSDYETVILKRTGQQEHGYQQYSGNTSFNNMIIVTSGSQADGVRTANWGPKITINNLDVITTGSSADGINASRDGEGTIITVNDYAQIQTKGGMGIRAVTTAHNSSGINQIIFNGSSSITTTGNGGNNSGYAVYAGNDIQGCFFSFFDCRASATANISLLGTSNDLHVISTAGEDAHAVYAYGRGNIELGNVNITTTGDGANGIYAKRRSAQYYYDRNTSGDQDFSGSVELRENVAVNVTGSDAFAFHVDSFSDSNGEDSEGKVASIKSYNSDTNEVVTDKIYKVTGNMLATNSGVIDLWMGDGSIFTGSTQVTSNGLLNLNIAGKNSVWNLTDSANLTTLDLSDGAVLRPKGDGIVPVDYTLGGEFQSAGGIIDLASNGLAGDQLTLRSTYVGSDDALLVVDTFLGGSGSDSDRIVNDGGEITGQTFVRVNNTDSSGVGAATEPGHGIKIVRSINDGTTTDDAFALDAGAINAYDLNGQTVVGAGAYAYGLYKGVNPLNSSGVDEYGEENLDNDWYLRSQYNGEEQYTAGVPIYEAYPQLLLGLNGLPTLQQRVGNRYWSNAGNKALSQGADAIEAYAPAEEAGVLIEGSGVWGRIEGSHTKIKSKSSTSGTDYDYNTFKMQAGIDGLLNETENGKLIGGVTVHYAHGKADVYSAHSDGDIKTNGYGFGGTLTWYGENGFYVDNQAQVTWYDSDLNADKAKGSLVGGNNGFGYALSVETGKRITINENWSLTPQAQLMYSNVRFDSFTDQFNGHVSKKRADSLQGRLGISADYQNSWVNDQGTTNRSDVYGIANLYNEFLNGTKVDISGVSFTNKRETLWAGIGLGGSYNWNDDKYSVYGEGSVNTSLKNFGDSYNYKGTVGFRVKW